MLPTAMLTSVAYNSGFSAVGCTEDTDARDNTSTTYTVIDERGAHLLARRRPGCRRLSRLLRRNLARRNKSKERVRHQRARYFRLGQLPHHRMQPRRHRECGFRQFISTRLRGTYPRRRTRCYRNPGTGPLSSTSNLAAPTANRPMYGLSAVFIVTETSTDASLSGP